MQYQVPQFIEVEDKIIGPLTGKQFFYLLGGAAIIFLLHLFFQWWLVIILGGPFAGIAVAMAFLKVNGVPFIKIMNNAVNYFFSNRLYLWRKSPIGKSTPPIPPLIRGGRGGVLGSEGIAPKLTESKLQDLAWSLDIQHKPLNHRKL